MMDSINTFRINFMQFHIDSQRLKEAIYKPFLTQSYIF